MLDRPSATDDVDALIGGTNDPVIRAALDDLFEGDHDAAAGIADVFVLMRARDDAQCDHIVPQALERGLSPDELFHSVMYAYGSAGSALAARARLRLAAALVDGAC
jgi:hypothetical protein